MILLYIYCIMHQIPSQILCYFIKIRYHDIGVLFQWLLNTFLAVCSSTSHKVAVLTNHRQRHGLNGMERQLLMQCTMARFPRNKVFGLISTTRRLPCIFSPSLSHTHKHKRKHKTHVEDERRASVLFLKDKNMNRELVE